MNCSAETVSYLAEDKSPPQRMRWLLLSLPTLAAMRGAMTALICLSAAAAAIAAQPVFSIETPMAPPEWALLQRELLEANTAACQEFFAKYFDERGYLECVERWGGDDGPDDAIENCAGWPILHALGSSDVVLRLYKKAWEGHLRQFTEAKTVEVPFARDGMYYKEFPVMFDWLHNGEGLTVFNLQGLSDPNDRDFKRRVRRYAGFYLNEDPGAPNYDPEHKIIRSLFNGSRGPLLRKATALDWTGDPIEVENRFGLRHGERTYQEMLAHFEDYTDIVGGHPENLVSTTLAMNAYMLTHEEKYRRWLLEYVDAWRERMAANGNVIPTNIGLDGTIGGECNGKWYGGTYGWAFTVVVPQTGELAHRNLQRLGFIGFMNAYVLTGDDRYLEAWRKQSDVINAQGKVVDGEFKSPRMYGDQGWYHFLPGKYADNHMEIYFLSMRPEDRRRVPANGWLQFLEGENPNYPRQALHRDLARLRERVAGMRGDTTTPDTRLSDDPMRFNPASIDSLVHLMLGGIFNARVPSMLQCRVRYFDPETKRAGIPEDVAALVEKLSSDEVTLTLVNTNQLDERSLVVQAGGYAEHQFVSVSADPRSGGSGQTVAVNAPSVTVRLQPGAGSRLTFRVKRYAHQPTMTFPFNRAESVVP
jgi:hypothetical protein